MINTRARPTIPRALYSDMGSREAGTYLARHRSPFPRRPSCLLSTRSPACLRAGRGEKRATVRPERSAVSFQRFNAHVRVQRALARYIQTGIRATRARTSRAIDPPCSPVSSSLPFTRSPGCLRTGKGEKRATVSRRRAALHIQQ